MVYLVHLIEVLRNEIVNIPDLLCGPWCDGASRATLEAHLLLHSPMEMHTRPTYAFLQWTPKLNFLLILISADVCILLVEYVGTCYQGKTYALL